MLAALAQILHRHWEMHPETLIATHPLFLSQDTLASVAPTPTLEPSTITKVNLLLEGVVRRVGKLPGSGVHLPEGVRSGRLEVASLFLDLLGRHVVARQDFDCLYFWGVSRQP